MVRYFFHVRDRDELILDDEGVDLPNLSSAQTEAVKTARDIVADAAIDGHDVTDQIIEICNEAGILLAAVPVRVVLQ